MATLATLQARLSKIQSALNGTLDRGVASYQINGRAISSFSLKELEEMESRLISRINRVKRGGMFQKGGFASA